MDLPTVVVLRQCPVEGCRGRSVTRKVKRVHFMHRHVQDTVIIMEEFNLYHPQCPRCDTLVPWKDLNSRNVTNSQCAKGVEQEISWMTAEEIRESAESVFQVYGRSIEIVTSFKDLGLIMTASDDDLP